MKPAGRDESEDQRAGRADEVGAATLAPQLATADEARTVVGADIDGVTEFPAGKLETGPEREDEGDAPWRRVEWFVGPRAYPGTEMSTRAVLGAYLESLTLEQAEPRLLTPALASPARWQLMGPGNFAGRVNAIAVDRTNTQRIYVGTASGGVWRTLNGGQTWTDVGASLGSNFTGAVAVQPTNGNVVYVGTGDPDIGRVGVGLFKSTNGGASFTLTGLAGIAWTSRIIVHPTNPSIVFAATNTGVHRSTDGGATWTRLLDGVIHDLAVSPVNPQTIWAARSSGTQEERGILRSTDGGANWTMQTGKPLNPIGRVRMAMCEGTPAVVYASFDVSGTVEMFRTVNGGARWSTLPDPPQAGWGQLWYNHYIAVRPDNANVVYSGQGTIYRSTNGGAGGGVGPGNAWQEIHDAGTPAFTTIHVDHHCLAFDPVNPATIYAGCDGGVYRSRFGGRFWEYIGASIPCTEFYAIGSGTLEWYQVGGGTQDNGTWHTDGSYARWDHVLGGDGFYYVVDPTNSNTIYMEAQNLWLARSLDKGRTWQYKGGGGIHDGDAKPWMGIIELDGRNPNTLYVGSDRLYRTDNRMDNWTRLTCGDNVVLISNQKGANGRIVIEVSSTAAAALGFAGTVQGTNDANNNPATWARLVSTRRAPFALTHNSTLRLRVDGGAIQIVTFRSTDFASIAAATAREVAAVIAAQTTGLDAGASASNTFTAIRVAPTNRNVVYAAAVAQIWRSADRGATWRSIAATPLPNRFITDIDVAVGNSNDVWVSVSGSGTPHVFRSTNGGASWIARSAGLPDTPANSIIVDPSRASRLWVATDQGVYVTNDSGTSWVRYSTGLPRVVVTDLRIHRNTGLLRAGTYGRGVWEIQATDPALTITGARTASNGVADRSVFRRTMDALVLTMDIAATQDLLDLGLRYDATFQIINAQTNAVVRQVTTANAAFGHGRFFWISQGNNWGPAPSDFTTPAKWGLGPGIYIFRGFITVRDTNAFSVSASRWFRVI
jgi:hypothetical protein